MTSAAIFIAASILLPAVALMTWGWRTMTRVEQELRAFNGFEGLHFDIAPREAEATEGAKWPTPG